MEEGYVCLCRTGNPFFENYLRDTGRSNCYKCKKECENPVPVQPDIKEKMFEDEYLIFKNSRKVIVLSNLSATLSK